MTSHRFPFESRLWAKSDPHYPLWRHLLDVGAVARVLLSIFPLDRTASEPLVAALLALHDIGKADPLFQLKVPALANELGDEHFGPLGTGWQSEVVAFRHEARSAQIIRELLRSAPFNWTRRSVDIVRRAIRGHHGNFESETIRVDEYPPDISTRWRELQRELCAMVLGVIAGAPPYSELRADNADVLGVRLSGVLVTADWWREWFAASPRAWG